MGKDVMLMYSFSYSKNGEYSPAIWYTENIGYQENKIIEGAEALGMRIGDKIYFPDHTSYRVYCISGEGYATIKLEEATEWEKDQISSGIPVTITRHRTAPWSRYSTIFRRVADFLNRVLGTGR